MKLTMDRLEAMSILVAVAEAGSLTAASRKLHVPLPTVSRKLAELEAYLATRLIIRSTRSATLTDAGGVFVAACKRILEQVGEAERAAAGAYSSPRGDLVITAPIVFGRLHVLPVVSDFLAAFVEINVRMLLADRNVHLIDDHIDAAVRIGALSDNSLVATRIGSVRRVVCASPVYLTRHGTPKSPADLAAADCITFDGLSPSPSWKFVAPDTAAEKTVAIRPRLTVNTAEAALDAAIAGLGVTRLLSYQAARAVKDGTLRIVLSRYEPPPLPVSVVHVKQGPLPRKLRAFLDFAVPRLRQRAAAVALTARSK
jgi:DNA-binding transcriptional LysR family regulator